MTDKIQKIREWVKARLDENASNQSLPQFYGMMEEDARFLDFLDSLQEEPVSEDLDEAAKEWLRPQLDKSYANYGEAKMMELTHFDGYAMLEAIEFGAKWKEKQLMDNVVLETEVLRDSDGDGVDTPYESWLTLANTEIPELPESIGLKEGDKVKILIVKSE